MPFDNPANITDLLQLGEYTNDVTSGMAFPLLLFAIGIILFIGVKNYDTKIAVASASFTIMTGAALLAAAGLITDSVTVLSIVVFLAAMFILLVSSR
jgi:hypothetical protein